MLKSGLGKDLEIIQKCFERVPVEKFVTFSHKSSRLPIAIQNSVQIRVVKDFNRMCELFRSP